MKMAGWPSIVSLGLLRCFGEIFTSEDFGGPSAYPKFVRMSQNFIHMFSQNTSVKGFF